MLAAPSLDLVESAVWRCKRPILGDATRLDNPNYVFFDPNDSNSSTYGATFCTYRAMNIPAQSKKILSGLFVDVVLLRATRKR